METGPMVFVRLGLERARVYLEGGIGFDRHVKGIGWVVNDCYASQAIGKLAVAVRNAHCKHLEPIGLKALCDCNDECCCDFCDEAAPVSWTVDEILAREG